jgi:7-cyano-7-deazaguanine synthase
MNPAVVLLSGGLDSAVSLALALKAGLRIKRALTFDYGHKAVQQEIKASRAISRYYKIPHLVIKLSWLGQLAAQCGLMQGRLAVLTAQDLSNKKRMRQAARAVWVPNRNALFINIAASLAESLECRYIITGFNREEAQTFPDNSAGFVKAVNKMLTFSTLNKVKVISYTAGMTKPDIVRAGLRIKVPLNLAWSCYQGGAKPCGVCESCLRRARAM